jgi:uncharacterized surface protein with fasciclin (FAS1) repeats
MDGSDNSKQLPLLPSAIHSLPSLTPHCPSNRHNNSTMMKLCILAVVATAVTAFTPSSSSRSSTALSASVLDTLRSLQGPGQVWGAEGIAVGKEESDFRAYDGFGKFCQLLQSTGVAQALTGPGPFTVFAPTDSAVETYERNTGAITGNALAYCVVPGSVKASQLGSAPLNTLLGPPLTYGRRFRKDFVNDAIVGEKTFGPYPDFPVDIQCDNGVIHAIGLIPTPP